jgi:hypothetical protein
MALVVEHLPNKHKALNLTSSQTNKNHFAICNESKLVSSKHECLRFKPFNKVTFPPLFFSPFLKKYCSFSISLNLSGIVYED